jgi:hypothetical protein
VKLHALKLEYNKNQEGRRGKSKLKSKKLKKP